MKSSERFLQYVKIDTTSNPKNAGVLPSSAIQFDLARLLVAEMRELGLENPHVDEQCYVYGWLPATPGCEGVKPLGFIAHMDTSSAASGKNVKPVLHENYDGGVLTLPNGRRLNPAELPEMKRFTGQTVITASGDTLLGADDKAGIAEILTLCEELVAGKLPHGRICVAFTPDEEIGAGANGFNVEKFGAAYAYTADGDVVGGIEYETFNAAGAVVTLKGNSVHPGAAKGIMVNSIKLAMELAALLPQLESPEHTCGREGFFHLDGMEGNVEKTRLEYIIRDHDRQRFEQRKAQMQKAVDFIREKYGTEAAELDMKDSYYNMGEVIEKHFHLVENAREAMRMAGVEPLTKPVRGGTDGSRLSFMGLPCPNLGTGGLYYHGPNEMCSVQQMDKAVEVLKNIVKLYTEA